MFGLPSPGFELVPIRRTLTAAADFAFIGDSVGVGIVDCCGTNLKVLTEGVFSAAGFDAVGGRPTQGGSTDGVNAARKVPVGTDLVVVELGYNDAPSAMGSRIDAVMTELRAARCRSRGVGQPVRAKDVCELRDDECSDLRRRYSVERDDRARLGIGQRRHTRQTLVLIRWRSPHDHRKRRVRSVAAQPDHHNAVRRLHAAASNLAHWRQGCRCGFRCWVVRVCRVRVLSVWR